MEVTMANYDVTINCPDCDGAGSYAITPDLSSSIEHECPVCDGLGERTFPEVTELYESVQELQEQYPKATIERIA
jgi:excinuclease UvrABC ATPase subunit